MSIFNKLKSAVATVLLFPFALMATQSVNIATTYSLKSAHLNEEREFHVYLPPLYSKNSDRRFPVVYVLDGDLHRLKSVAGMLEGLSTETLESQVKQAIVVAIPNSKNAIRERDFTPTNVNWEFKGQILEEFSGIGNAKNYAKFFNDELIPHIEKKYQTSEQRLLIGESFGGLFASYTLLTTADTFTDYLIIDATYLWDNNYLNRTIENSKKQLLKSNVNVYLTFANNAAFGDIGKTNKEWGYQFYSNLSSIPNNNLNIEQRYFDNESHGTVALQSWYYGLKALLSNNAN